MRIAIKFSYDGRNYYGYARQLQLKTIEGEIINSLMKHGIIENAKDSCFRSASRTDKGVSALCNIFAFNTDTSKKQMLQDLSSELTDIVFYGIKHVEPDFNPRYANQRQYRYYLFKKNFDVEKIIISAALFTGEHDFSNFAQAESFRNPVRTIDNIVFEETHDFLIIDFFAQTFLWHQIRRIVSALAKVGHGKLEKEQIIEALAIPEKKVDFGLAPAEPLVLKTIVYNFEFEYDEKLLEKTRNMEKRIISYVQNHLR